MTNNKNKLLDIGMNLTRIGNWITDDYTTKKKRIRIFFNQTSNDLHSLDDKVMPTKQSRNALKRFKQEYPLIESSVLNSSSPNIILAEKMFTWGNILTHKAALIKN